MELVMIGGQNYVFSRISMEPIKRGSTVTVSKEDGELLLASVWYDKANNAQPYFVPPTDLRAAKYQKDAPKKRRGRRAASDTAESVE